MHRRVVSSALVALLAAPAAALGWGAAGHRIVGELAARRLEPGARRDVAALLHGRTLAAVSMWADDIRDLRPETANWHFVDIPIRRGRYLPAADCRRSPRGDCLLAALARERAALADRAAPGARRGEALQFLVHLVADLHQPLHCADDDDRGGNEVRVRFFGRRENLHAVWDSGLLRETRLDQTAYVRRLEAFLRDLDEARIATGTFHDWALETHAEAARAAYRGGDGRVRDGDALDAAYLRQARPVLDRQLAKAGVRLARVLNEALAPPPPPAR